MRTQEQTQNLITLALYLRKLKPSKKFNMKWYVQSQNYAASCFDKIGEVLNQLNHRGTAACAIGHAPLAGIAFNPNETWEKFECRTFGVSGADHSSSFREWLFMFDGNVPNDPRIVARRIAWVVLGRDMSQFDNVTSRIPWTRLKLLMD